MDEEPTENATLWWFAKLLIFVSIGVTLRNTTKCVTFYGHYVILGAYIVGSSLLLMPFLLLNPRSVKNALYSSYVLRSVSTLLRITFELRNCEILRQDRGGVFVANHRSFLDLVGIAHIVGVLRNAAAVGKKELFYFWPFGLVLWLVGTVFLDRANSSKAKKQLNKAARMMKDDKVKLMIFPEGTRNRTDSPLLPFKKGAFRIAIDSQVPIFPVVYSPYYFIDRENMVFNSGTIVMKALPPIETADLTIDDIDDVMERTRTIMLTTFMELSEEFSPNKTKIY